MKYKNNFLKGKVIRLMAKMVNPNSVNDMEIINAKAQAKMSQLVQKIGKGKRKVSRAVQPFDTAC